MEMLGQTEESVGSAEVHSQSQTERLRGRKGVAETLNGFLDKRSGGPHEGRFKKSPKASKQATPEPASTQAVNPDPDPAFLPEPRTRGLVSEEIALEAVMDAEIDGTPNPFSDWTRTVIVDNRGAERIYHTSPSSPQPASSLAILAPICSIATTCLLARRGNCHRTTEVEVHRCPVWRTEVEFAWERNLGIAEGRGDDTKQT